MPPRETAEDEVLDRDPDETVEPPAEPDDPDGGEADAAPGEAEETLTVQIGDEEPEVEPDDPDLVNKLRKMLREETKARKALEAQTADKAIETDEELGPEPQEGDPGIDYDAKVYRDRWNAWDARRKEIEAKKEAKAEEQKAADERWRGKLGRYEEQKTELKATDYADAEDMVRETFSVVQQGIVVQGAKNPALLFYALGKNPKKAKELAAITDPVEFAFAAAEMEAQLKVTRKGPPPPEGEVRGTAGTNGAVDNTLERLRAEAAKTGDLSKVVAYKRSKKAA